MRVILLLACAGLTACSQQYDNRRQDLWVKCLQRSTPVECAESVNKLFPPRPVGPRG